MGVEEFGETGPLSSACCLHNGTTRESQALGMEYDPPTAQSVRKNVVMFWKGGAVRRGRHAWICNVCVVNDGICLSECVVSCCAVIQQVCDCFRIQSTHNYELYIGQFKSIAHTFRAKLRIQNSLIASV